MTREEAQIIIGNIPIYGDDCYTIPEYQEAKIKAIEALERPEQKWIPCSERLPKNPKSNLDIPSYLTCINDGRMQILAWCDGWNCCFEDDGSIYRDSEFKDVVAWMPLPEPYKENKG